MLKLDINSDNKETFKDNFIKIQESANNNPLTNGEFTHFEVTVRIAGSTYKVKHNLGYTPTDVLITYISDSATVTPVYASIDKTYVVFNVSAACVFRFVVGRMTGRKVKI